MGRIRTTQEHPFYAYNRGWTAAVDLTDADWILTASGDWKQVEEIFATGVLEVVYNLRVADWHTYFVGDESWNWAAWAHNACIEYVQVGTGTAEQQSIGANYAQSAWNFRDTQANSAMNSERERWLWTNGYRNIGYGTIENLAFGNGTARPYVSRVTYDPAVNDHRLQHSEERMIGELSRAGYPSASHNVLHTFTERSPCSDCREQLVEWLHPQNRKVIVYFIIGYEPGDAGSALIDRYHALGYGS